MEKIVILFYSRSLIGACDRRCEVILVRFNMSALWSNLHMPTGLIRDQERLGHKGCRAASIQQFWEKLN